MEIPAKGANNANKLNVLPWISSLRHLRNEKEKPPLKVKSVLEKRGAALSAAKFINASSKTARKRTPKKVRS